MVTDDPLNALASLCWHTDPAKDVAGHFGPQVRQDAHRAQGHAHVDVVAASMHDTHVATAGKGVALDRGKRQAGGLGDGQPPLRGAPARDIQGDQASDRGHRPNRPDRRRG